MSDAPHPAVEVLARWAQQFVMAERWKGCGVDVAPPELWANLRDETRQFWRDEAARILGTISPMIIEAESRHQEQMAGDWASRGTE